jgi:glycosyltransferase involved in cell wall biosynthesis
MRILIISQYFTPDITAAAYRIGDTYRLLKKLGHEVRVITATPHKGGQDEPIEVDLNVEEIGRIRVYPLKNRTARAYIEQYLGFALRALFASLRLRKNFNFDVVWATSPPLFMACCTIPLKLLTGRPVVLDIRDIWPESAVNIGKVRRGSLMERFGKVLEWVAYTRSDALTCVSHPMKAYLGRRTKRQITVVYNGVPQSQLVAIGKCIPDAKVFCYAGNIGYAQGIDGLLRAFAIASKDPTMSGTVLEFIGDGAVMDESIALACELGLKDQVRFLGMMPKHDALGLMRRAGTLLIPLLDSPAFQLTVPSKVFDCLSLGRPILATMRGEGQYILESTGANVVVPPGNVGALAEAFVRVHRDWIQLYESAHKNIEAVSSRFSRELAVKELEKALEATVRTRGRTVVKRFGSP